MEPQIVPEQNTSPIKVLPDEILLRIFSILVGWDDMHCDYWMGKSRRIYKKSTNWCGRHATIISGVNTSWRYIMLNTASFWSHIDVFLEYGCWLPLKPFSLRCLRLAKDVPIELHIHCDHTQLFDLEKTGLPISIRDRVVASLVLMTTCSTVVQPVTDHYSEGNAHGPLKKLRIEYIHPTVSSVHIFSAEQTNQSRLFENMHRLDTLMLSSVTLDWALVRFSGLVDLQLYDIQPSPSMDQIYDILFASPQLSTVQFEWLHMDSSDVQLTGFRSRDRVKLPMLSFLGLGGKDWDFVGHLLQAIEPGARPLCLKIGNFSTLEEVMSTNARIYDLHSFCARQKITTLLLHIPSAPLHLMPPCPKDLINLVFVGQDIGDFDIFLSTVASQGASLRHIILRDCRVTITGLRGIASIQSIRSLWLEYCMYAPRAYDHYFPELPKEELNRLENTIPDLYVDYAHHERKRGSLPWWLE